jgi:phosphatidate cytidylyltransferase
MPSARRSGPGRRARNPRATRGAARRPAPGEEFAAFDQEAEAEVSENEEARERRPRDRAQARTRRPARVREPRQRSDLGSRILIAVPAAIIAVIFVDLGGLAFAVFMVAVGAVCMYELYRMLARWRPAPSVGFAALAAMVISARYGTERDVLEVAVAALPVTFLVVIARGQQGASTVSIAGTLLGIYWIGFAFAHAELLRQVDHGNAIIIDVLVGTFLGDTAAYFGGRLFGRRPLAPAISPQKTVEGLFCGMLIAILAVFVAGLYQPWLTQGDALLLGITVAVLGPIGDLFESVVKRDSGIKDSGVLFGSHGGALDRLDAVIFTIVAGYYVWLAVMH